MYQYSLSHLNRAFMGTSLVGLAGPLHFVLHLLVVLFAVLAPVPSKPLAPAVYRYPGFDMYEVATEGTRHRRVFEVVFVTVPLEAAVPAALLCRTLYELPVLGTVTVLLIVTVAPTSTLVVKVAGEMESAQARGAAALATIKAPTTDIFLRNFMEPPNVKGWVGTPQNKAFRNR